MSTNFAKIHVQNMRKRVLSTITRNTYMIYLVSFFYIMLLDLYFCCLVTARLQGHSFTKCLRVRQFWSPKESSSVKSHKIPAHKSFQKRRDDRLGSGYPP